jgi:hypothetical protein
MATCEWCDDSTKALLEIWSDEQVQKKLKKGGIYLLSRENTRIMI